MSVSGAPAPGAIDGRFADILAGMPPIVCFANDWNGDPTSKHHIMRRFARHVPVLWVESSGMRRPNLRSGADLRRIATRVARASAGRKPPPAATRSEPGITVVSPLALPLPGNRGAERLNRALYRRAVLAKLPAGAAPILWVYTPTVAPYLDALPHSAVVYHCVDRWWAFSEYDGAVMRRHHEALCRCADVVFASASELLDDCREFAPDAVLMRHGVDWEHFAPAAFDPPPRPADIADITTPILGFFGLLHDWIDQDLLVKLAHAQPHATLVLIGKAPVDIARLTAEPNIRWLGQKPFAELPAYAAAFDAALVPFVRNELTAAVNPIKLLEYLSAGVPVIATDLPEIVSMTPREGLVAVATDEAFIAAVAAALRTPLSGDQRRRIAAAHERESWGGRCVAMAERVAARVALNAGAMDAARRSGEADDPRPTA